MTEIPFANDEPLPDLAGMTAMVWRLLARAIRAGRAQDAKRWLSVHARLTAMARADPPEPETDPAPARARPASSQVHPMHPVHHVFPLAPSLQPESGPDPP